MSNATIYDELDQAVNALIAEQDALSSVPSEQHSHQVLDLLQAARELQHVARPHFKAQLKRDLMDQAFVSRTPNSAASRDAASYVPIADILEGGRNGSGPRDAVRRASMTRNATPFETPLPSLFAVEGTHAARRGNFAASVALHAAVVGAFVAS